MLDDTAICGEFFDETYEAFYEDLDLAWRAHDRGWKGFYTPKAVAYHVRGGTAQAKKPSSGLLGGFAFPRLSDQMKARVLKNRWFTIIKNDKPLKFLLNLPFILIYDIKTWAYVIFFAPRTIPFIINGMRDLPEAWRRRKLIHGA